MTLTANIAALIDAYAHAERTNLWNEGSPFPTPGFVNMVPETRAALESAIAELAAERDAERENFGLLSQRCASAESMRNKAEQERDAAVAKCAAERAESVRCSDEIYSLLLAIVPEVRGNLGQLAEAVRAKCAELEREMAAAKAELASFKDSYQRAIDAYCRKGAAEQGGAS